MVELRNSRRNFETLVENDLLTLELDVFGPFDETGQVACWADVLTNTSCQFINSLTSIVTRTDTKVFGIRLEERVLLRLGRLAGTKWSSSRLFSSCLLGGLVIETEVSSDSYEKHCAPEL